MEDFEFIIDNVEERASLLGDYLGEDDVDYVGDYLFNANGSEYLVVTEDEAEHEAVVYAEALLDDMGLDSVSDQFEEQILENHKFFDMTPINNLIEDEINYFTYDEIDQERVDYLSSLSDDSKVTYVKDLLGDNEFKDFIRDYLNTKEIAEEIVRIDGPANSLASYDGKELDLGRGYYAYRVN